SGLELPHHAGQPRPQLLDVEHVGVHEARGEVARVQRGGARELGEDGRRIRRSREEALPRAAGVLERLERRRVGECRGRSAGGGTPRRRGDSPTLRRASIRLAIERVDDGISGTAPATIATIAAPTAMLRRAGEPTAGGRDISVEGSGGGATAGVATAGVATA